MKKIKSVKILKDWPGNKIWAVGNSYELSHFEIEDFNPENYPDIFEIEYETEPEEKVLKRPDGSLISGFEMSGLYWLIYPTMQPPTPYYCFCTEALTPAGFKYHALTGHLFSPQDGELAKKKCEMLNKQLEIKHEIDRLNAEQGWAPDWNDSDQPKHYLDINYNTGYVDKRPVITAVNYFKPDSRVQYAPYNVLVRIHKKYSEAELKQYLGIIE